MYVGRIVAVGKARAGQLVAMYRVSSRSYPNRQARRIGDAIAVLPRPGFESDIYENPYIAYNCLRLVGDYAVVGNGTHTDSIAEKLDSGMRMRDAILLPLYGRDYEHDAYATPRIAGVVDRASRRCALGVIRRDAVLVREFEVEAGEALYVATYEHNTLSKDYRDGAFEVVTAEDACDYVLGKGVFSDFDHPISAACAFEEQTGFSVAFKDAVPTNP
jgi:IMP cyclohydrolase